MNADRPATGPAPVSAATATSGVAAGAAGSAPLAEGPGGAEAGHDRTRSGVHLHPWDEPRAPEALARSPLDVQRDTASGQADCRQPAVLLQPKASPDTRTTRRQAAGLGAASQARYGATLIINFIRRYRKAMGAGNGCTDWRVVPHGVLAGRSGQKLRQGQAQNTAIPPARAGLKFAKPGDSAGMALRSAPGTGKPLPLQGQWASAGKLFTGLRRQPAPGNHRSRPSRRRLHAWRNCCFPPFNHNANRGLARHRGSIGPWFPRRNWDSSWGPRQTGTVAVAQDPAPAAADQLDT